MSKKKAVSKPARRHNYKTREFLNAIELQFCQFVAEGASRSDAARWAGAPYARVVQWAYEQMKRPLVQKTIEELTAKLKETVLDGIARRKEERDKLIHNEFGYRLRHMKTHKYRGDEAIVKMIEVGFKSTGAIQPVRNVNTANSVSIAESKPLYIPVWRRMQMENPAQSVEGETLENVPRLGTGEQSPR
jgi:hypothetical protein